MNATKLYHELHLWKHRELTRSLVMSMKSGGPLSYFEARNKIMSVYEWHYHMIKRYVLKLPIGNWTPNIFLPIKH